VGLADYLDGARLLDSATHSVRWRGLSFVPVALWTPDGWGDGVLAQPLDRYTSAYLPMGVQPDGFNLLEYHSALWVRARLPMAVGFAPPTCRRAIRWRFLGAALLAVGLGAAGPWIAPFVCADRELQAELRFGRGCPADRRRSVASAFWGLLASDPAALANYRDRVMFADGHDVSPTLVGYWRGLFHLSHSRW
jgi:hypothetical protein